MITIVPTRGRNDNAKEFSRLFFENSSISDLVFGLDEDDQHQYERLEGVKYEVHPRLKVNGTLNLLAKKYCSEYEYLAFMGDDQRLRTPRWDETFYKVLKNKPLGLAYGDDLIQSERLPTSVVMDSRIVQILGYMAPPCLTHMYIDNFWLDLGLRLQTLFYFPDVVIEHAHFSVGKANLDKTYLDSNNSNQYAEDFAKYRKYLAEHFEDDVQKLLQAI